MPFEIDGEAIPLGGFATMTLLGAVLGGLLARRHQPLRRAAPPPVPAGHGRAHRLSCVPSLTLPPDTASKIALVAAHLLAAVVIVPVLARHAYR